MPPDTEEEPAIELIDVRAAPTLQTVINRLEAGHYDQAETYLLQFLDARPGNALALRFLEQLQRDPETLMGPDYHEVTVQPGESLSVIAARELGDSMQFFALARYNQIPVPKQLAPGMTLRVPLSLMASPVLPVTEPPASQPERPGDGLVLTGQQLIERQRFEQAIALLSSAARGGHLDAEGQRVLALAGAGRLNELTAEGDGEAALALLDRLDVLLDDSVRLELEPERNRARARVYFDQAIAQRRAGRDDEALERFEAALALNPEFDSARQQAEQLRASMVMQFHERALVHYRDHELAEAIALWERVLMLDEQFEPARVYLPRARALQSRLEELDS